MAVGNAPISKSFLKETGQGPLSPAIQSLVSENLGLISKCLYQNWLRSRELDLAWLLGDAAPTWSIAERQKAFIQA
jgi:hypothetical protein